MEQRLEPRMELTQDQLVQAIWYDLRDVKKSVERIEGTQGKEFEVLNKQVEDLKERISELEKFRFGVQMMAGPLWALALVSFGTALGALVKVIFHV